MNVVFDFDKTLTQKDTTRRLFFFLAKRNHQSAIVYVVCYGLYRLGLWSEHRFKSALVHHYIRGRSLADLMASANKFVNGLQDGHLNETTIAALRQHLVDGDRVFVASANFDFLIQAFCATHGITDFFATSLEVDGDQYTGSISGTVVKGQEKTRALETHFGKDGLAKLKFYGDAEDQILLDNIPNHVKV